MKIQDENLIAALLGQASDREVAEVQTAFRADSRTGAAHQWLQRLKVAGEPERSRLKAIHQRVLEGVARDIASGAAAAVLGNQASVARTRMDVRMRWAIGAAAAMLLVSSVLVSTFRGLHRSTGAPAEYGKVDYTVMARDAAVVFEQLGIAQDSNATLRIDRPMRLTVTQGPVTVSSKDVIGVSLVVWQPKR